MEVSLGYSFGDWINANALQCQDIASLREGTSVDMYTTAAFPNPEPARCCMLWKVQHSTCPPGSSRLRA